jgi:hypothetical protein
VRGVRKRRAALITGIVLAVFSGIFGQDLGELFTGQATDPGTGPLLVLFAVALWPAGRIAEAPLRSREKENLIRPFSSSAMH